MSDSPQDLPEAPSAAPPTERALVKAEPPMVPADAAGIGAKWIWPLLALAGAGIVSSALLWQKLNNIQEELARRSLDSGTQAIEARTLAKQAQEGARELAARLALQETRVSEVSLQRSQLEELMQSLSRSRDENLVVDLDSALRLAQQQAQLTGSAEPLLAALRSADQRLARAAQPRLNPLQRAIARDIDRIKAAALTDVPGLLLKLDELTRNVDELPLANALNAAPPKSAAAPASAPRALASAASAAGAASVWERLALRDWPEKTWQSVRGEAQKLLRVSRIDQPEAALIGPEQSFFLRENLKLRLLNARLALLSRQTETARADLAAANAAVVKYFAPGARQTQGVLLGLQQAQVQLKSTELPRLDETLAALATAAAGR